MDCRRKRQRSDFTQKNNADGYYDTEHDHVLIEQSIAKQYGVLPSMQGELSYSDWAKMVGGLMDDTPLGRIVGVRSEKDKDIIKNFTPEQRRIRSEWASFRLTKMKSKETDESKQELHAIQTAFLKMFGGGK